MSQFSGLVKTAKDILASYNERMDVVAAVNSGFIGSVPMRDVVEIANAASLLEKHGTEADKNDPFFGKVKAAVLRSKNDIDSLNSAVSAIAGKFTARKSTNVLSQGGPTV